MAALVQTDPGVEAAARADLKDVVQELAQLARLRPQRRDPGVARQQLRIVVAHHAGAAAGRADHVLVRCEHVEHLARQLPGIVEEAGVRHRLATTSLRLGEVHPDALPLQQLAVARPTGVQLVDVAGHEERDVIGLLIVVDGGASGSGGPVAERRARRRRSREHGPEPGAVEDEQRRRSHGKGCPGMACRCSTTYTSRRTPDRGAPAQEQHPRGEAVEALGIASPLDDAVIRGGAISTMVARVTKPRLAR